MLSILYILGCICACYIVNCFVYTTRNFLYAWNILLIAFFCLLSWLIVILICIADINQFKRNSYITWLVISLFVLYTIYDLMRFAPGFHL